MWEFFLLLKKIWRRIVWQIFSSLHSPMNKELLTHMFQILTTIVGVVMSVGYFPQAYKIYKNKSAENISVLSFSIAAFGTMVWTLYGVFIQDLVVILSFVVGVIGSRLVLLLTLKYRKKLS